MIIGSSVGTYALCLLLCISRINCFHAHYSGEDEVDEGESFTIECTLDDIEDLKWTRDGDSIDEGDGYSLDEEIDEDGVIAVLKVESATSEHEGDYRCNKLSRDFHHLTVGDEDDKETTDDLEDVLDPDKPIELHCEFGNSADVEISWYKNGAKIDDDDHVMINGPYLTIKKPDEGDSGRYMCKAKSPEDRKDLSYVGRIFEIKSGPGVHNFSQWWSVVNGRDLTLECNIYGGYPKPTIRWYIGNEAVEHVQKVDSRVLTLPNDGYADSILYMEGVTYNDRMLYTCEVENRFGKKETSTILTIRENMIKTNEEESGKGLILVPRKDLVLQCNTTECAKCKVEWLKDGDKINTTDDRILIHENNNSVIITSATEEDAGYYMCIVDKNVIGHVINATIHVKTKTQIRKFPKSINSVQGDKLTLHCNITSGSPAPTIIWYKDSQVINDTNGHIKITKDESDVRDSLLIIEELEFADRAHYTCEADNGVNADNTTVFVRVKDKLAALWPFLGICAEVAILCTIIFVYEKKKVKEGDESDTDNPDPKPIPDAGRRQDIRQRK